MISNNVGQVHLKERQKVSSCTHKNKKIYANTLMEMLPIVFLCILKFEKLYTFMCINLILSRKK